MRQQAIYLKFSPFHLEAVLVHRSVLPFLPQPVLELDIGRAVDVQSLIQIRSHGVGLCVLDDGFRGFQRRLVFALQHPAFVARRVPRVVLLVRSEVVRQPHRIFRRLVPYLAQRHLKEQDSVVVLAHKVTQVFVFLFQVRIGVLFHLAVAHRLRQVVLRAGLAHERSVCLAHTLIALHLTQYLLTHAVKRLNAALPLQVDDMPTEVALERSTYLAYIHPECRVLKRLHHHPFAEPAEVAPAYGRALVVRQLARHIGEVLRRQQQRNRVDSGFLCGFLLLIPALHHLHHMRSMHLLVRTLFLHKGDMETIRCAEHLRYLAHRRGVHRVLKRIDIAERRYPSQFPARLLHARVGRHLARYGEEILLRLLHHLLPFLYRLARGYTHASVLNSGSRSLYHAVRRIHRALYRDMCGAAVHRHTTITHLHKAVYRSIIPQILRRSLRAVALQLF